MLLVVVTFSVHKLTQANTEEAWLFPWDPHAAKEVDEFSGNGPRGGFAKGINK